MMFCEHNVICIDERFEWDSLHEQCVILLSSSSESNSKCTFTLIISFGLAALHRMLHAHGKLNSTHLQ